MQELSLSFASQGRFYTQGQLDEQTEYVWIVFHGYKQLARFFLRKFAVLEPQKHFIVAPQGLSKFYLGEDYQKVGASWLTKEDRILDLANQQNYLAAVWQYLQEMPLFNEKKLCLLGFSQGVATVVRWVFHQKIAFDKLILWAGIIPYELREADRSFLKTHAQTFSVIGTKDMFFNQEVFATQSQRAKDFFRQNQSIVFEGEHEVVPSVLSEIVAMF